jgi:hypothetical protein
MDDQKAHRDARPFVDFESGFAVNYYHKAEMIVAL